MAVAHLDRAEAEAPWEAAIQRSLGSLDRREEETQRDREGLRRVQEGREREGREREGGRERLTDSERELARGSGMVTVFYGCSGRWKYFWVDVNMVEF